MQTITLRQSVELYHINPRLENHGDEDRVKAADLNVSFETGAEFLDRLAVDGEIYSNGSGTVGWETFFFHDNGSARLLGIPALEFDRVFEDHTVEILKGKEKITKFADVRICKIKAKPVHGKRFEIRLQLQAKPNPAQMAQLYDLLGDTVKIVVKPPAQADLLDNPDANALAGTETEVGE